MDTLKCSKCGTTTAWREYVHGRKEGSLCSTLRCTGRLAPSDDTIAAALASGPKTILEEAQLITGNGGERNDSYDHPHPNFSKIAAVWSVLFGVAVTPRQVALAMIGMKMVRDNHRAKRDNILDIAGYARCIERLDEWEVDHAG